MSKAQFWARETIITIEFRRPRIILPIAVAIWTVTGQGFQNTKMTGSPILSVNLYKIEKSRLI